MFVPDEPAPAENVESEAVETPISESVSSTSESIKETESANTETEPVEGEEGIEVQQGAYNPETGEINWDCPCLGGMANGPCGEEFKAAFSCFVYSEAEPKGIDCIEKFSAMQACFREHPEEYAEELRNDDDINDNDIEMVQEEIEKNDKISKNQSESTEGESMSEVGHQLNDHATKKAEDSDSTEAKSETEPATSELEGKTKSI